MKNLYLIVLLSLVFALPAFAGVSVSSPSTGDIVNSPFDLSASTTECSGQPTRTIGYSFDSSSDTTLIHETTVDVQIAASTGPHTLHVKTWGNNGAACTTDVKITVAAATDPSTGPVIPSNAISVSSIDALSNWFGKHDSGTSGSITAQSTSRVASPSQDGSSRKFYMKYTNRGGDRFSSIFGEDQDSTHFVYDAWIYIANSAAHMANLELDLNQTMSNGKTVIYGFQCGGYSGKWEYSGTHGWLRSNATCNPRNWSVDTWHHVQIQYSRDDSGNITYQAVWFDGTKQDINTTVPGARSLGWGKNLSTNFQIDGYGSSGSNTLYLDDLTVYRW